MHLLMKIKFPDLKALEKVFPIINVMNNIEQEYYNGSQKIIWRSSNLWLALSIKNKNQLLKKISKWKKPFNGQAI